MYLKKGDTGVKVTYLQYGLHILCCTPGSFDGSFGDATEKAVRKYQEAYGLEVDGQAGDATWNSISGEIKPIQRALSMKGYYHSSLLLYSSVLHIHGNIKRNAKGHTA